MHLDLADFRTIIPKKPYCSDNLSCGLRILPKELALLKRYIQLNHPYYTYFFIFDIDQPAAYVEYFYSMVGVPTPNLIIENPENGHAHFIYRLKTPIYNTDASRQGPIKLGNAVYNALRELLSADIGYSGLIAKNAIHEHWRTNTLRKEPYTLNELSKNLDLTAYQVNKLVKVDEAIGLGRNSCVFHTVRHWAYVEIRKYRAEIYSEWFKCVLKKCESLNMQFITPMSYNEVKAIAKSIARFCWKNDAYCYQEFIDRQSRKGKLGASTGGKVRSSKYGELRLEAKELYEQGFSKAVIARKLAISRKTITRWLTD